MIEGVPPEGRSWVVLPAGVQDAAGITTVHVRSWQAAYKGILPETYLDALGEDEASRRARWRVRIGAPDDPRTKTWVAVSEGRVAGFAVSGHGRDEDVGPEVGELQAIYVDPNAWGAGAGSAHMRTAIRHLTDSGYSEAILWVFEENTQARGFYERHGWKVDGSTHIFERETTETLEVRYRRPLG